jgi:hypothetical protein
VITDIAVERVEFAAPIRTGSQWSTTTSCSTSTRTAGNTSGSGKHRDPEIRRAERHEVPLLSGTSTPDPNQSADPDPRGTLEEHTMSQRDERVPAVTAAGIILIFDPKKMWPVMAVRGALAILFGITALTWPSITLLALALLFGAWALLDGVSLLINAFRQGRAHVDWRDWVPSLLAGLLGIAAAVVTVLWPPSCSWASASPRSFSRSGYES